MDVAFKYVTSYFISLSSKKILDVSKNTSFNQAKWLYMIFDVL